MRGRKWTRFSYISAVINDFSGHKCAANTVIDHVTYLFTLNADATATEQLKLKGASNYWDLLRNFKMDLPNFHLESYFETEHMDSVDTIELDENKNSEFDNDMVTEPIQPITFTESGVVGAAVGDIAGTSGTQTYIVCINIMNITTFEKNNSSRQFTR